MALAICDKQQRFGASHDLQPGQHETAQDE
jgi:hypothetical protein